MKKCHECQNLFEDDELYSIKKGYMVCYSCGYPDEIHDDCFKPSEFNFIGKDGYYLGVELEIEREKSGKDKNYFLDVSALHKHLEDFCYFLDDCSVGQDCYPGFEIVTHPISHNLLIKDYIKRFSILKEYGFVARSNCGMHVHVSINQLDKRQKYNLLRFMFNSKNEDYLHAISGRDYDDFKEWSNNRWKDWYDTFRVVANNNSTTDKDIICVGHSTYEFRMFTGTVCTEDIKRNIEFVVSILNYCKSNNSSYYEQYLRYLERKSDLYPLIAELSKCYSE